MKGTIMKTALITALSLVCILFLGVFSTYLFAPKLSAELSYNLGMKGLSSSCYERVYKKTGELDDLIVVIDSAVYAEKTETVEKYGLILFDTYGKTSEFANYCRKNDEGLTEDDYSTYDYYANTVFMALYNRGEKEKAAEFAIRNMVAYSDKCALKMAVILADPTNDRAFGDFLVVKYKSLMKEINTANYNEFRIEMRAYKNADGKEVYKF
ncbi:MAG: hypothetical protein IKA61_02440 [Clostridia bacterium]|nr:hypothetical protein [Clostridia bacterium]